MLHLSKRQRASGRLRSAARTALLAIPCATFAAFASYAQAPAGGASAAVPAGADAPAPTSAQEQALRPSVSPKQARQADDEYLAGAKQVQRGDLTAAEAKFAHAVQLNPGNRDYALALLVTRSQRVSELVRKAARERAVGHVEAADALLAEAHKLDPDDPVVAQHFAPQGDRLASAADPAPITPQNIASTLAGAIELTPATELKSFHQRGDLQTLIRTVYSAYGIQVTFDSESNFPPSSARLDLDNVDFQAARQAINKLAGVFAVPVQPKLALIARNTPDARTRLEPLLEETIYMPGLDEKQMQDLANVARTVFDVKQVTANTGSGDMLLRGDEDTLRLVNATFADMLDGGSDVVLDVNFYEVDTTLNRNIGAALPSSAGIFSIAAEAQQLVSANQTLINQAIASGLIKVTGNSFTDLITEVGFLIASGTVSATQYTNLLGIFGNGLTLAGVYLGSSSTFNLLLNSSDVRTLDAVQIRASNGAKANFRAGSRYPVVTAIYSTGVGSTLSSALGGLNINGTSVSSLLSQYLGSTSVTVPQFQFEDLGLTLNTTPQIQHSGDVNLKLELKIEALAGSSINSIPILNSRSLTSSVTVPEGQTALLASEISRNEEKSIQGLPGLSELPGFQGTDQNVEKDTGELLITITPHIVRRPALRIASRRLLVPAGTAGPGGS